ncbi:hypothetical protein [Staphylococcus pettenkoferi]|uniref:hypothetical protein n=1 Tax=Staphylococcus pettenkoferi TaxID=170573 RepID=UPI002553318B|nr:hypothetical protein [Staphylococcus pettenkoferi]MDK7284299.1 hypothetical protein [Staphylococcus pettenkoferi]
MAEPLRKKENHQDEAGKDTETQKKGFIKKGLRRFKSDIKHSSRVEEGSLIDMVAKGYKRLFPKK